MVKEETHRCGSVSIIGLPNAGKSTLVNVLVGQKVTIVSPKVQTTRRRIMGIAVHKGTQILLIDTPGIFQAKKTLEKAMVAAAMSAFDDMDFIIHIVDMSLKNPFQRNADIIAELKECRNAILVLNKVDKVDKPKLLDVSMAFNDALPYAATFMVSALSGKGTADILNYLASNLPEGDWAYPEDQITDMPMRLLAAEITREKVFLQLHEEIPYAVHVETEEWEEFDNGSVRIAQAIVVQKESQKAVVLGKGGARIKSIGQSARMELEEIMERPVHLKIFVKVDEKWAERAENLSFYGLQRT